MDEMRYGMQKSKKDDVVACSACGRTYKIAIDGQTAQCNGKATPASIPHSKLVRMK